MKKYLSKYLINDRSCFQQLIPRNKIFFGVKPLDRILGNGVPSNVITELYGSAGSGKTQLCLQLVCNILKNELSSKVLFICTQERFSIDRLVSMLGTNFDYSQLDRVHVQYFLDSSIELNFFKYMLHSMVQEFNYKLIIYDGIASNARNIENIFERVEHIHQILGSLRRLFLFKQVCIIITNQITEVPNTTSVSLKNSALGLSLENSVNIKIYLELEHSNNRSIRSFTVKKSLFTPLKVDYFTINSDGLKGVEDEK